MSGNKIERPIRGEWGGGGGGGGGGEVSKVTPPPPPPPHPRTPSWLQLGPRGEVPVRMATCRARGERSSAGRTARTVVPLLAARVRGASAGTTAGAGGSRRSPCSRHTT